MQSVQGLWQFLHSMKTFLRNYTHNVKLRISRIRLEMAKWRKFNRWYGFVWFFVICVIIFGIFPCFCFLFIFLFDSIRVEFEPCRSNVNACRSSNVHKITNRRCNWGWTSKNHPKRSSSKFLSAKGAPKEVPGESLRFSHSLSLFDSVLISFVSCISGAQWYSSSLERWRKG